MRRIALLLIILIPFMKGYTNDNNSLFYLVNGKLHLFKIFVPNTWINNINIAHENGIATFFHPKSALNTKYHEVYIYANGYDYNSPSASFNNFVNEEIANMKTRSKEIIIENVKYNIKNMTGIKQFKCISFTNIPNSYRDDCVYIDTGKSVISIIFTTNNINAYLQNKPIFTNTILTFSFISSDPTEIHYLIEKDKKDRPETKYYKVPQ